MKALLFRIGLLLFLASCAKRVQEKTGIPVLRVSMQDSLFAGDSLSVRLGSPGNWKGGLHLLYLNSQGIRMQRLHFINDTTVITKEEASGLLEIYVFCQGKPLSHHKIVVLPGAVAGDLQTLMGPKSMVTGGSDYASLTCLPADRYGNPVSDSFPVSFHLLRPDERAYKVEARVYCGLARYEIVPQQKAGKTLAKAHAGNRFSDEKALQEIAGPAENFRLYVRNYIPYADARQVFRTETDRLHDRYGNLVPDGTQVLFQCTDPDSSIRQMNGYTIAGVAQIDLQNPINEGILRIQATVNGGGKSNVLQLIFRPPVDSLAKNPI